MGASDRTRAWAQEVDAKPACDLPAQVRVMMDGRHDPFPEILGK
jgi:hypothetical protein